MPKVSPIAVFREDIRDAHVLVSFATTFTAQKPRKLRSERRMSVGQALRIPKNLWSKLDGLSNQRVFVLFKNVDHFSPSSVSDATPLLRQAVVAACAALESFLADKAADQIPRLLKGARSGELPPRFKSVPISLGDWLRIENSYKRKGHGIRGVIAEHFRQNASTAPSKVGELMSTLGISKWTQQLDSRRGVARGLSEKQLEAITARRNQIAHAADRPRRVRRPISADTVAGYLTIIEEVAEALDLIIDESATRQAP